MHAVKHGGGWEFNRTACCETQRGWMGGGVGERRGADNEMTDLIKVLFLLLNSIQLQHFQDSDTFSACSVILCFHNPPNSDMDHTIFKMHTHMGRRGGGGGRGGVLN